MPAPKAGADGAGPSSGPEIVVGRLAWQEHALARCREIRAGWDALRAGTGPSENVDRTHACAEEMLRNAQDACEKRPTLRLRISGAAAERAWANVHAAEALLIAVMPVSLLPSVLPRVVDDAHRHLGEHSVQRHRVDELMEHANEGGADRLPPGSQVRAALALLSARHVCAGAHLRVRSFRNTVAVAAGLLGAAVIALAVVGWLLPGSLPMCTQAGGCLPSGHYAEVTVVALVGAAAGLLAGVAALRRVRGTSTPYSVPVALAFLKCPAGALSAILGILLLSSGILSVEVISSGAEMLAWAVVLGASQQLVTRLADEQAQDVLSRVKSGTDASAGGEPS